MKFSKMLFVAILLAAVSMSAQELKLPSLSPTSTTIQEFSQSKIEIVYSRPSMRGRKIFGEVVPFGEVWRTGANAATKITLGEDLVIGGKEVKAGTYSLYTKPGASEWEVILNKKTGGWETGGFPTSEDVARFTVRPATGHAHDMVETFTISIADMNFTSCNIVIAWENTKVSIPVKNYGDRIVTQIDKAINNPNIPYQAAASYYLETNQQLDKALAYADKAIEAYPKGYWLYHMKARIAAKMGRKDVAIAAANKSIEVAKGTPGEGEYTRNNQKLIESLN